MAQPSAHGQHIQVPLNADQNWLPPAQCRASDVRSRSVPVHVRITAKKRRILAGVKVRLTTPIMQEHSAETAMQEPAWLLLG